MAKSCEYFEKKLYQCECEVCGSEFYFKQPEWPHWIKDREGNNVLTCSPWCMDDIRSSSSSKRKDKSV